MINPDWNVAFIIPCNYVFYVASIIPNVITKDLKYCS